VIYFVALEHPQLNVAGVAQRVAMRGHPVPTDKIVERYQRCLALLPDALDQCDRAVLFDNSYRRTDDLSDAPMLNLFCEVVREARALVFRLPSGERLYDGSPDIGDVPRWFRSAMQGRLS
jgi:hypothetical protein